MGMSVHETGHNGEQIDIVSVKSFYKKAHPIRKRCIGYILVSKKNGFTLVTIRRK